MGETEYLLERVHKYYVVNRLLRLMRILALAVRVHGVCTCTGSRPPPERDLRNHMHNEGQAARPLLRAPLG